MNADEVWAELAGGETVRVQETGAILCKVESDDDSSLCFHLDTGRVQSVWDFLDHDRPLHDQVRFIVLVEGEEKVPEGKRADDVLGWTDGTIYYHAECVDLSEADVEFYGLYEPFPDQMCETCGRPLTESPQKA